MIPAKIRPVNAFCLNGRNLCIEWYSYAHLWQTFVKGFITLNQINQGVQTMLRIALCDDDLNFIQELQQNIMEWYQGSADSGNISITKFSDSYYLARTIDSGSSFDVFFVDIEMPQMSGL